MPEVSAPEAIASAAPVASARARRARSTLRTSAIGVAQRKLSEVARSGTMAASVNAPDSRRMLEKLAASMLPCCNARRHSSELAAKATIAVAVSSQVRSTLRASVREAIRPDVAQDRRRDLLDRL